MRPQEQDKLEEATSTKKKAGVWVGGQERASEQRSAAAFSVSTGHSGVYFLRTGHSLDNGGSGEVLAHLLSEMAFRRGLRVLSARDCYQQRDNPLGASSCRCPRLVALRSLPGKDPAAKLYVGLALVVAFASDVVREPVACAGGIEIVCGVLLLLRAREAREWAETRRRLVREGTLAKDK